MLYYQELGHFKTIKATFLSVKHTLLEYVRKIVQLSLKMNCRSILITIKFLKYYIGRRHI